MSPLPKHFPLICSHKWFQQSELPGLLTSRGFSCKANRTVPHTLSKHSRRARKSPGKKHITPASRNCCDCMCKAAGRQNAQQCVRSLTDSGQPRSVETGTVGWLFFTLERAEAPVVEEENQKDIIKDINSAYYWDRWLS